MFDGISFAEREAWFLSDREKLPKKISDSERAEKFTTFIECLMEDEIENIDVVKSGVFAWDYTLRSRMKDPEKWVYEGALALAVYRHVLPAHQAKLMDRRVQDYIANVWYPSQVPKVFKAYHNFTELFRTGWWHGKNDVDLWKQLFYDNREVCEYFDILIINSLESEFFIESNRIGFVNADKETRTLLVALQLMNQIATQYKDCGFETTPRKVFETIYRYEDCDLELLSFLFCALVALSELSGVDGLYRPLVPDKLALKNRFYPRLKRVLS
jgi:hypothetical protein